MACACCGDMPSCRPDAVAGSICVPGPAFCRIIQRRARQVPYEIFFLPLLSCAYCMHYGNINAYVAVLIRRLLRSPYCRNNSMHPPYSIPWSLSSIFIYVIYHICTREGLHCRYFFCLEFRGTAYSRFLNDVHHISGVFQNLLFIVQKILIYPISRGSHRKIFSLKTFDEVSPYW